MRSLTPYILVTMTREISMNVYSRNNLWRARLSQTDDGVSVAFDQYIEVRGTRGVNVSLLDTADLPANIIWKQINLGFVDNAPFHIVRDHVYRVLETMT